MKKLLLVLIVVLLSVSMITAFSLTGCKKAAPVETTAAAETTSAETTAAAETTSAETTAAGPPVELTLWDYAWGSNWEKVSMEYVDRFNKENPNIHVTYRLIGWDVYSEVEATAMAAGTGPDITTRGMGTVGPYIDKALPLDSIIEEWRQEGTLDLNESYFGVNSVQGSLYSLPWNLGYRLIIYRQDAFDKAGITKLPETFAEFVDASKKIREKTDYEPFDTASNLQILLMYNDTNFFDAKGNLTFNTDPKFKEVLQFIGELYDVKAFPSGAEGLNITDYRNLYLDGKLAMFTDIPPDLGSPGKEAIFNDTRILAPLIGPSNTEGKGRIFTWVNGISALKNDHPEETKFFVKWWCENLLELFKTGGVAIYPAKSSFYEDPYYKDNPISARLAELQPDTVSYAWPLDKPWEPQFFTFTAAQIPERMFAEILLGNKDYDGIIDKYYKEMKKMWDENPNQWWMSE